MLEEADFSGKTFTVDALLTQRKLGRYFGGRGAFHAEMGSGFQQWRQRHTYERRHRMGSSCWLARSQEGYRTTPQGGLVEVRGIREGRQTKHRGCASASRSASNLYPPRKRAASQRRQECPGVPPLCRGSRSGWRTPAGSPDRKGNAGWTALLRSHFRKDREPRRHGKRRFRGGSNVRSHEVLSYRTSDRRLPLPRPTLMIGACSPRSIWRSRSRAARRRSAFRRRGVKTDGAALGVALPSSRTASAAAKNLRFAERAAGSSGLVTRQRPCSVRPQSMTALSYPLRCLWRARRGFHAAPSCDEETTPARGDRHPERGKGGGR